VKPDQRLVLHDVAGLMRYAIPHDLMQSDAEGCANHPIVDAQRRFGELCNEERGLRPCCFLLPDLLALSGGESTLDD
jgi:hypothetical protein